MCAALDAQSRAVGPADRVGRQHEHHRVPYRRFQVEQVAPHPADARSKVLRPSLRDINSPADELTRRIEAIADEFTPAQTDVVARFLRRLTEEITDLP